ncbi:MAG: succinate dehydrogenase, hydrophobic membrane anchor protein [Paracoccus sp. (in: a-proteobacteria)]|uniref:succinate dehydrogenase, hydrophobic membrane anchor protein n=1 Tax=Paracoccus sp. TaxID=267 RepID=UPI00391CA58C
MRYITPRKAAMGLGSARSGTAHHWNITVSSYALVILTPLFLIAVGQGIGLPQAEVIAHFGRPFPAIITALFVIVGMLHFIKGSQGGAIADYVHGTAQQLTMIAIAVFGWGVIAAAIFALAKMAFTIIAI